MNDSNLFDDSIKTTILQQQPKLSKHVPPITSFIPVTKTIVKNKIDLVVFCVTGIMPYLHQFWIIASCMLFGSHFLKNDKFYNTIFNI